MGCWWLMALPHLLNYSFKNRLRLSTQFRRHQINFTLKISLAFNTPQNYTCKYLNISGLSNVRQRRTSGEKRPTRRPCSGLLWKTDRRLIVLSAVFISKMQNKPKAVHIVMGGTLNVFFYLIKNALFSYAAVRGLAPGDMTAQFHLGSHVLKFSPDICRGQVCLDSRKHIWNFLFPINLWLEANGHININDLF